MKKIGVIFTQYKKNYRKKDGGGGEFYSGKTEEGHNIIAYINKSKKGSEYLSVFVDEEGKYNSPNSGGKTYSGQFMQEREDAGQTKLVDNKENIIDPDDLPF